MSDLALLRSVDFTQLKLDSEHLAQYNSTTMHTD